MHLGYSVRTRFRTLIMIVVISMIILTAALMGIVLFSMADDVSKEYARLYTSELVGELQSRLAPEIALSLKAASTDNVTDWMKNASDPQLRKIALSELVKFTHILGDQNLFVALKSTNEMHFIDPTTTLETFNPSGILKKSLDEDAWYFNTMASDQAYILNIDKDRFLGTMHVWINAKVEDEGEIIGVIGTGLYLDSFIDDFFSNRQKTGVKSIIINSFGDIQMDSETEKIRQNSFQASPEISQTIFSYGGSLAFNKQVDAYLFNPKPSVVLKLNDQPFQYVAFSPIKDTDWHVATFFKTSALFRAERFYSILSIMLVMILILGLLINHIAKSIFVEPFEKLNESIALKEVTRNHELYGMDRNDEFGILARSVEEMSDRLIRFIPVGLFLMDHSNKLIYANPYVLDQLGYGSVDELRECFEKRPEALFANIEDVARIIEMFERQQVYYSLDLELLNSEGRHFWTEMRLTRINQDKLGWQYEGIMLNVQINKEHEEALVTMANTDPLTGIYNRYHFDKVVADEVGRNDRYGDSLSLIIFDLDHFKHVNDNWGHAAGDHVLKKVADEVTDCLRKTDVFVRWGGEEFAVLMPATTLTGAHRAAEKMRIRLEGVRHENIGTVTASFGVAERLSFETYKEWFARVDQAMYKAKEMGRNQVVIAETQDKTTASFVQLVWQDAFSSGNDVIDQQHQKLFVLTNAFMDMTTTPHDHDLEIGMFRSICQHINTHLIDEENILLESGYDNNAYLEHAKSHQRLKSLIFQLQENLENRTATATEVVLAMINEVVLGHMMAEDTLFFNCLRTNRS